MSQQGYLSLGIAVVGCFGWLLKWWISKSLDSRFEARERADREYRKEQIEDAIRQQHGQQVMIDGMQVMLKHMITGDHIEELERSQKELERFSAENNENLLRKAAKYNQRWT